MKMINLKLARKK